MKYTKIFSLEMQKKDVNIIEIVDSIKPTKSGYERSIIYLFLIIFQEMQFYKKIKNVGIIALLFL